MKNFLLIASLLFSSLFLFTTASADIISFDTNDRFDRDVDRWDRDLDEWRPDRWDRRPWRRSCRVKMVTRRGRIIETFRARGQRPCRRAMRKCRRELRRRHFMGRNRFARCVRMRRPF